MGMVPGGADEVRRSAASRAYNAAVYTVIFVLGVAEGVIGSFQYGQSPAPLVAMLLDVLMFATCVRCGWGIMTFGGALAPAAGWILAPFFRAMGHPQGPGIIPHPTAGHRYLHRCTLA